MVRVKARTLEGALPCPSCGVWSYWVHSQYRRHLADASVGGHPVVVDLSVRRLFCDVTDCARRTLVGQGGA
ncbi:transposase family protein [Streptomyces sp. NPDC006655]|uniref:transposase family protein n=1 Tax=Streptomyces sp. NPDC006655 TaxID=3156898 RepID=UPI003456DFA5